MLEEDENDSLDDVEAVETDDVEAEIEDDLSFGDDDVPESDVPKRLRLVIKDKGRENADLKRRVAELESKIPQPNFDPGPRPTREQFDYDDDQYDKAIDDWNATVWQSKQQEAAPQAVTNLQREFEEDVKRFETGVAALAYDDGKETVESVYVSFTQAQQTAFVQAVKDPAKLAYALGRNPEKLAELAGRENLAKFIAEAARLEANMAPRKRAALDTPVKGNASPSVASSDKTLARLEKEAERTGDRTELIRYRRSKAA